jgi:hypothetical protein
MTPDRDMTEDRNPRGPIEGRQSIDYLLTSARTQLTDLSAQADLKASIVITTSSLVLTLALSRINSTTYRTTLAVLSVGVLGALIFAIIAVIPKFKIGSGTMPADEVNPLFFGHVATSDSDEYTREMLELFRSDEDIYRTILADVHAQSSYLIRAKYRWLRLSYVLLLAGFVGAAVARLASAF